MPRQTLFFFFQGVKSACFNICMALNNLTWYRKKERISPSSAGSNSKEIQKMIKKFIPLSWLPHIQSHKTEKRKTASQTFNNFEVGYHFFLGGWERVGVFLLTSQRNRRQYPQNKQ